MSARPVEGNEVRTARRALLVEGDRLSRHLAGVNARLERIAEMSDADLALWLDADLPSKAAAEIMGVATATLARWRWDRDHGKGLPGPPFTRRGGDAFYRRADVLRCLATNVAAKLA